MPAPLLHSRIRDSIEIRQSPRQVLDKIKVFSDEQFRLELDEADHDNIHFEMTQKNEEFVIHGVIRRWQGTESRLDFMGEVNIPESASQPNRLFLAGIILIEGIFLFKFIILDSLSVAPANTNTFLTLFMLFLMWFVPTMILAAFTYWIMLFIRAKINQGNDKHWQVQQELAKIIEEFRELETDAN